MQRKRNPLYIQSQATPYAARKRCLACACYLRQGNDIGLCSSCQNTLLVSVCGRLGPRGFMVKQLPPLEILRLGAEILRKELAKP